MLPLNSHPAVKDTFALHFSLNLQNWSACLFCITWVFKRTSYLTQDVWLLSLKIYCLDRHLEWQILCCSIIGSSRYAPPVKTCIFIWESPYRKTRHFHISLHKLVSQISYLQEYQRQVHAIFCCSLLSSISSPNK